MYTQGRRVLCLEPRLGGRQEGKAKELSLKMRSGSHFTRYFILSFTTLKGRCYQFCVSECDSVI